MIVIHHKIGTIESSIEKIDTWRSTGLKIVFTNGCFDILHAGHVRSLSEAKGLGDILVVGVNSDSSISRLKGPSRPINNLSDRTEVLACLSAVDLIIPFDEDTPLGLIEVVKPNILAKGGDYDIQTIIGANFVTSHGGEVRILHFHEGYSTSDLIKKMFD